MPGKLWPLAFGQFAMQALLIRVYLCLARAHQDAGDFFSIQQELPQQKCFTTTIALIGRYHRNYWLYYCSIIVDNLLQHKRTPIDTNESKLNNPNKWKFPLGLHPASALSVRVLWFPCELHGSYISLFPSGVLDELQLKMAYARRKLFG